MKTAFILAGFDLHETATSPGFLRLRKGLKAKGYKVVPVSISWYRKTASEYVDEFIHFYAKQAGTKNIIIGNSFGAIITLLAAPTLQPNVIYLCSLSPYFKEDQNDQRRTIGLRYFGKHRLKDLRSYSANEAALKLNNTKIKTFVLYGEKEKRVAPDLVARCKDMALRIKHAELIELPQAPHDMSDNIYTSALLKLL